MALTNVVIEDKEVEVKPAKRNMTLEYIGGGTKISPIELLDTGAQVSCLKESVFNKLKIPTSVLRHSDTKITAANGSVLENLGTVELKMPCICYVSSCTSRVVRFHIIRNLSEEVLV